MRPLGYPGMRTLVIDFAEGDTGLSQACYLGRYGGNHSIHEPWQAVCDHSKWILFGRENPERLASQRVRKIYNIDAALMDPGT